MTLACLLGVVVAGVALAAWTAVEGYRLVSSLSAAADDLTGLQRVAVAGDVAGARALLPSAQRDAAAADSAARSVPLRLAGALPRLHADVAAARTVAATVHGLTTGALPELLDALGVVAPEHLLDSHGRVQVDALARVAPRVRDADSRIAAAQRAVAGLDASHAELHAQTADAVGRLQHALDAVRAQTRTAARAATLLPPMLGADGPRRLLVMVQNNAELRSTGGIPGAVLLVEADHGAVTVTAQRGAGALDAQGGEPVLPLTGEELTLFGVQPAVDEQDVNLIPDFPRSAQLLAAMWRAATGVAPDGVVSVDPVALAGVLGATGPVTVGATTLTGATAARVLLHDVYLRTNDPREQDAFFAATARATFDRLLGVGRSRADVLAPLAASAREGRLMVWSAHPDEQRILAGTVVSGELVGHIGRSPVVGVYLDDGSAAKMSWFVDSTITVRREGDELVTSLTLTNTGPAGGRGLPSYLTGGLLPRGEVRTNYDVYAPTGSHITRVTIDGRPANVFRATYRGLEVAEWTAQLAPGAAVTVAVRMSADLAYPGTPRVRATPAGRGQRVTVGAPER